MSAKRSDHLTTCEVDGSSDQVESTAARGVAEQPGRMSPDDREPKSFYRNLGLMD